MGEQQVSHKAQATASHTLNTSTTPTFTTLTTTGNTSIGGTLTVSNGATFNSGLTIAGNLQVNGTTTTLNTQDLFIEDRFIYIGGKQNKIYDVGIVFNNNRNSNSPLDSGTGKYETIFFDNSAQRFKVAGNVDPDQNDFSGIISENNISGSIVTIRESSSALVPGTQNLINNPQDENISPVYGNGEMIVTYKGEIFMYTTH